MRNNGFMRLSEWMEMNEITPSELAEKLGHSRVDSIQRWMKDECVPQERHREMIKTVSDGQVVWTL